MEILLPSIKWYLSCDSLSEKFYCGCFIPLCLPLDTLIYGFQLPAQMEYRGDGIG